MSSDLTPETLDELTRAVCGLNGPLAVVVQLDGNVRIDDAIDDAPLASMRQGQAEQKANANGIVALVNAAPSLLAAAREWEEAMRVLDPNMPEQGLVDAAKQVKQVAVSATDNTEKMDAIITTLRTQVTALTTENARLREALTLAYEWAAKYPLHGDGSVADCQAATTLYVACGPLLGPVAALTPTTTEEPHDE